MLRQILLIIVFTISATTVSADSAMLQSKLTRNMIINPENLMVSVRRGNSKSRDQENSRIYQTTSSLDVDSYQTILVLEGEAAFISTGQSIPVLDYYSDGFYGQSGGLSYRDISTGFYVTPTLSGNKVRLKLSEQQQHLRRDGQARIDTHQTETQLSVRLGQWIQVAGTSSRGETAKHTRTYKTREHREDLNQVFIKVDRMP